MSPLSVRMQDELDRIASQLERSYFGDAWHGPSLNELIEDPDWRKAFEKPVPGIHSIYELVHHIAVWAELGHEACLGRVYDQLPGEMDWWPPPDNPTNSSWLVAQARCRIAQTSLITELRKMSEAALHVQLQGKEYSLHHLLLGILQHNAYHSGQIALLKNALK